VGRNTIAKESLKPARTGWERFGNVSVNHNGIEYTAIQLEYKESYLSLHEASLETADCQRGI